MTPWLVFIGYIVGGYLMSLYIQIKHRSMIKDGVIIIPIFLWPLFVIVGIMWIPGSLFVKLNNKIVQIGRSKLTKEQ